MPSLHLVSPQLESAVGSPPFSCSWSGDGVWFAWVRPVGELDFATAPVLDEAINAAQSQARMLVVDLRGLTFVDSSVVHLLVEARLRAALLSRQLTMIPAARPLQDIFDLVGPGHGLGRLFVSPQDVPAVLRLVEADAAA